MMLLLATAAEIASLTSPRDSYPNATSDGRLIVFQTTRSGKQALWLANADGSNPRHLFDGGTVGTDPSTPVWSPDGRSIAFAMRPARAIDENESEIYTMRADGTQVRRLTTTPGDDSHPHWTADGRRIFFNSARATPDLKASWGKQWIDIYSMAADGSEVRRHTNCKTVCTYPVPSPDGRFIVHRKIVDGPGLDWALDPGSRDSEVFVTAVDGTSSVNVSKSTAYDGWPVWSPNGRWIVFASNRDKVAYTGQLYAVRPDGTQLRSLTSGVLSRVQHSFTPDGKSILVAQRAEGEAVEIGHVAKVLIDLPE